jgi:UDP-glucose 4-epimerase
LCIGTDLKKRLDELKVEYISTDIVGPTPHMDVRDFDTIMKKFKEFKIDSSWTVIHLAAKVTSVGSLKEPHEFLRTNVYGTLNVLEAMRLFEVPKIVFPSSAVVYGSKIDGTLNEDSPHAPDNPYGLSKHMDEQLIKMYSERYGLNYLIVRPTFVYGPDQVEKNVLQQIMDCGISGEEFVVFGDGTHIRMPVYIDDMIDALMVGVEYDKNDIFNIAGSRPVTINEMISIVKKHGDFDVTRKTSKFAFPQVVDTTKVNKELGWSPKITIEEGIKRCLEKKSK